MKKQLKLNEIKEVELQLLLDFKCFCEDNDLKYYLCGGTLLGAIRHKGFIPWDDDIDVCMPRNDYMRFINLIKNGSVISKNYGVYAYELSNSFYPFAKLFDKRYYVEQKYTSDVSLENLWIDILPMDGLPDSKKKIEKIYKKNSFRRKLLMLNFAKNGEGTTLAKKIGKIVILPFVKIIDPEIWCKKIVNSALKNPVESSPNIGCVTWGLYGVGECMEKVLFYEAVDVEFEGYSFKAMKCWNEYLKGIYGDYMQLPPYEKRKTHEIKVWIEERNE